MYETDWSATVSIDDFYLTAEGQNKLREANPGNALLEFLEVIKLGVAHSPGDSIMPREMFLLQDFIIFPLMHSMVNFLEFGYDPCFMVLCIGYLHVHREKTSKMELFIISGAACLPHPSNVPSILQYHDSFGSVNRNENEAC
ncbi:hypothetical protein GLYMA_06G203950v4 [Glycine max]|nr:hypothetical protein GLYMA_06G203950v4 [Glycine max]